MIRSLWNAAMLTLALVTSVCAQTMKHVQNSDAQRSSVIVQDTTLLHSSQVTSTDEKQLWATTQTLLKRGQSSFDEVAKLNLYATQAKRLSQLERFIRQQYPEQECPAICSVVTPLPDGKTIALDFVAVSRREVSQVEKIVANRNQVSMMPRGKRIYISGQAAREVNLKEAAAQTLQGLLLTMEFLKRNKRDVASIKAFLMPMEKAEFVMQAVTQVFGEGNEPPVVFVQWQSSEIVPVEIEMVIWGGKANETKPVVEYLTPPGMTSSPVFSRICRINSGPTIFLSGISSTDSDIEVQIQQTFDLLTKTLHEADSDIRHLVKATYYVIDGRASSVLGSLRPKIYTPLRPPAASKATVPVIGERNPGFLMDMIAVPVKNGR